MKTLLNLAALACLASPLAAQAPPNCSAAEHHQFDFWIGSWSVTDSAGATPFGTNQITSGEGGCLLHEHWSGSKGGSGQSFNFYDRVAGKWEQVWVASGGSVLRIRGGFDGKSMVMEGEANAPSGAKVINRIAWTPQSDGRVRQLWSTSSDGGKTWQVAFDGWYRKVTGG